MKRLLQGGLLTAIGLACAGVVSAHVSLNPKEVVAGYASAVIRVPNEKEVPTIQVRLVVPKGVEVHGVMPISGWVHTEKREAGESDIVKKEGTDSHTEENGDGDEGPVTEIVWSGGKIGVGEFMEFPVSVKYPADAEKVTWKAYQTYQGGEVVPWDGTDDGHPAPEVAVLKEAKADVLAKDVETLKSKGSEPTSNPGVMLSVAAVLMSVLALAVSLKSKKTNVSKEK